MKYYIRRAVVGAIATPLVAGVYFVGYALLVGLGAEPTTTPQGVWDNGIFIGVTLAVMFTFLPQTLKLVDKLGGEN